MKPEYIILVNEKDQIQGKIEKLEAHQKGLLHRAFSVFIFNGKGELMLQQRADHKYHSGGLWTNTCCSHPNFGENTEDAVKRRLKEEMDLSCSSSFAFSFIYKAKFNNGLIENEFDHVYIGKSDQKPLPNPNEVKNWKYISIKELSEDIETSPQNYTAWLKICLPLLIKHLKDNNYAYI